MFVADGWQVRGLGPSALRAQRAATGVCWRDHVSTSGGQIQGKSWKVRGGQELVVDWEYRWIGHSGALSRERLGER